MPSSFHLRRSPLVQAHRICLCFATALAGAIDIAHAAENAQLRLPGSWSEQVQSADGENPASSRSIAIGNATARSTVLLAAAEPASPLGLKPASAPSRGFGADKSYWIPALDIVGFDLLLNQFNRRFFSGHDYDTSIGSIRRNLRRGWVVENDPFQINQFGHPYQGSMYHGFARSAGLGYWASLAYTFAGSAFWEIAGETTPPSRNDQISTGIGGSFLGESLFRMASLLLENAGDRPGRWRELGAAAISPATGFNRHAFDDRFKAVFSSHQAVYYSRFAVGLTGTGQDTRGPSTKLERNEAIADFSLDYGMPGKPGYAYDRPFDYFAFQASMATGSGLEMLSTRGLLLGSAYEAGQHYRGIWGLYGSYDYISPQLFRVSTTALSLGTTGQLWLTPSIALQGTIQSGVGYAAVGTLKGTGERDYHYGVAPQALAALRLILGDKASIDLTAREYYVSGIASSVTAGHDNIARFEAALTYRIQKQHAIALRYLWSRRDAFFPDLGDRTQSRGTIGIYYTLLGHDRFGAVEWR